MSLANSVFRDRTTANWPSVQNSPAMADAIFAADHGMSREEWRSMMSEHARRDHEEQVCADLEGEPPTESLGSWVGRGNVAPHRMMLARFVAWRESEVAKLAALEKARAKLVNVIEAPSQTQLRIGDMIKSGASRLLAAVTGNTDDALDDDAISRRVLDKRLSAQRHLADAAREAISIVDSKIAVAQIRVARLREREAEFLQPAIIEYADAVFAGIYLVKAAELKKALLPLLGLHKHLGYDSRVSLPSIAELPTLAAAPSDTFSVRPSTAAAGLWSALAKAWAENPFAEPPSLD